jgi:hypothetical protein
MTSGLISPHDHLWKGNLIVPAFVGVHCACCELRVASQANIDLCSAEYFGGDEQTSLLLASATDEPLDIFERLTLEENLEAQTDGRRGEIKVDIAATIRPVSKYACTVRNRLRSVQAVGR